MLLMITQSKHNLPWQRLIHLVFKTVHEYPSGGGGTVTFVMTEGGADRQGDNKQHGQQHGQQPGRGSGTGRSIAGHLRWQMVGVLSGIPLGQRRKEQCGASARANCREQGTTY